jgi:hypothetical protein
MYSVGIVGKITRLRTIASIVLQGQRPHLSYNCTATKWANEARR